MIKKLNPFVFFNSNIKKDNNGIEYISGFRRNISVFIDLIILILLLHTTTTISSKILLRADDSTLQVIEKYKMGIQLNKEEIAIKNNRILFSLIIQLIELIILFLFVIYMWVKFSGTPGKLLLGLRVVDKNTFYKMTILQSVKRFFAFTLSVLPVFLGIIWSSFDKRCQTWHDKIANTVVVTNKSLKEYLKIETN